MKQTFSWFSHHGITLETSADEREYKGTLKGIDGIELVILSAGEIPHELGAGRIHLGVTGSDLVYEHLPDADQKLETITPMGFGHADLIIAVPDFWRDVTTLHDLDSVAADFRADHGFRLRIATKYHHLVQTYLHKNGVADYQLVDSQGATEGTIKNQTAEAIADITSTGATLRANHLRILNAPVIHASQATLFQSLGAPRSAADTAALDLLRKRILG